MKRAVVLKLGGELLESPDRLAAIAKVIKLASKQRPLIVVHGGGREIDAALAQVGIPKRQVDGLRVTDPETLEIVVSVLALQVLQALFEQRAHFGDVRFQRFELCQHIESGPCRQQVAAIGGAVVAGENLRRDVFADERRADRNTRSDGLADGHQVGRPAERLVVKRVASAAEATLDFVGDQQRAGRLGHPCDGGRELWRQRTHAAFALDRFRDEGSG